MKAMCCFCDLQGHRKSILVVLFGLRRQDSVQHTHRLRFQVLPLPCIRQNVSVHLLLSSLINTDCRSGFVMQQHELLSVLSD